MATCRDCGVQWTALSWAHCASCHQLFTGVTYFDFHRVNGECWGQPKISRGEKPSWQALVEEDGVWSSLEGHEYRKLGAQRMIKAREAREGRKK